MQFQADMLQVPVVRSEVEDASAFGALIMNGFALGKWHSFEEAAKVWTAEAPIVPQKSAADMQPLYDGWHHAVQQLMK